MATLKTKDFAGNKSNNNLQNGPFKNNSNGSANWNDNKPVDPWLASAGPPATAAGPFKGNQTPIQCYKCGG